MIVILLEITLIKRKNEATQAAADLELVFRQGCEQKIKDFKVLPNNFYDNTFIVGFIAGVLEALIDLQCLKGNALWAMNSQKWPDKLKLNFQINFIQNLDGYGTSLYHRSLLDAAQIEIEKEYLRKKMEEPSDNKLAEENLKKIRDNCLTTLRQRKEEISNLENSLNELQKDFNNIKEKLNITQQELKHLAQQKEILEINKNKRM